MSEADIKLWGGVAMGVAVLTFNMYKPYLQAIVSKIPNPLKLFSGGDKVVPVNSQDLGGLSRHEVLSWLIDLAIEEKDDEGVTLLGSYGKHLYDVAKREYDRDLSKKIEEAPNA